jgi:MFS family permease
MRARALGIFSGLTGLAVILGPIVGGAVAEGLAWQWIFWINVPIGIVCIPLALRRMRESFGSDTTLDIGGLALAAGAAFGIVWGLVRGNGAGWDSLEVVAALVAGILLAAAFVAWELRTPAPMVPMRLLRSRAFSAGIVASFLFYGSLYGAVFLLPLFFQVAQGHGALAAGLRLLPWTATLFVVAPIAGGLVNRLGERTLAALGLLMQAAGMAWIALLAAPGLAYAELVAPLIIAGAGVSMAMPAAQNAVLGAVAIADIGKASGTFNMLRYLGGAFGIAVVVAVFAAAGNFGSAAAFSAGFVPAMGVGAALTLAGTIAALGLPGRRSAKAGSTTGSQAPIGSQALPQLNATGGPQ